MERITADSAVLFSFALTLFEKRYDTTTIQYKIVTFIKHAIIQ